MRLTQPLSIISLLTRYRKLSTQGSTPLEKRLQTVNCVELLRKTGVEIKSLNYQVQKIANSANLHKELTIGFSTEVDAIPEELVYARFKIKQLKEAVKFIISWGPKVSQEVRSDLRIYISCKY